MKTVALFAAAVLLATAVVNARATTLNKQPAASGPDTALLSNSLGRKMATEGGMHDASMLGKTGLQSYDDDNNHILVDINTLRTFGLIGEDFRHVDKATEDTPCMTKVQCAKKKLVCSKKCSNEEVNELHPFAAKCILHCKKCLPTC